MNERPDLPNIDPARLERPTLDRLEAAAGFDHPPRILMLYGSLRERSFSRFLTYEAARILEHFGAEVKIFDPTELPMVGSVPETHPKVVELRELCLWSEGQVWCSPERHGAVTAVMKNQIDWIPLEQGAIRPSQGRTLAVMQCAAARNPSTWSTRCACWGAGCACSRSRTSPRCRWPTRSSTTTAACARPPTTTGWST
jgi:arsenical resistance protein ArsH